jgi:hypothetical protein
LLVAATAALAVAVSPGRSAPYVPTDESQPLERLPTAGNQKIRELRKLHAELARSPADLALAVRVATQDIEAARAESDPRYNGYAEAALAPWLALPNPPNTVLLLRATLRQATHEFSGALDDLNRVISADPRSLQARLTRAIILQVRGEYADGLKACFSLALFNDNLVTTTCIASVNSLQGQAMASPYRHVMPVVLPRSAKSAPEPPAVFPVRAIDRGGQGAGEATLPTNPFWFDIAAAGSP